MGSTMTGVPRVDTSKILETNATVFIKNIPENTEEAEIRNLPRSSSGEIFDRVKYIYKLKTMNL